VSDAFAAALEDLDLDPARRERLAAFARLVAAAGGRLNLTADSDPAAIAAHIRDSLTLVGLADDPLVDVGSGGGFPAIPIVIATDCRAVLVESSVKKARFLSETASRLGLPLLVVPRRAEDAARDPAYRERFRSATARAVGSAPTVLELTVPFLVPGGSAILQRGAFDEPERSATLDAALALGAELREERRLEGSRRILVFTKRAETPARFPRRSGVPAKRPLCAPGG
jgi:16S rRNA (guanine527-N7)-methyltransferase